MSREEYKGAIEVSVIFHEGQRMFAVPKQPAPVEPVAILNHAHGIHTVRSVKLNGLPDGEYNLYTAPPAQRTWVSLTDEQIEAMDCINALWDDGESCTIIGIKEFARKIETKLKEKNT